MDPFEVERIWEKMYQGTLYYGRSGPVIHAMSGIDIAIWDIIGQATRRPVAQMLGGMYRDKIKAYASLVMPDTMHDALRLAEKYLALGYKAMKFGWGPFGQNDRFDIEAVQSLRSVIGPDIDLMIDIGHRWTVKQAIHVIKHFEEQNVYWVEEPLPPDDLLGYRQLSESVGLNIAAGEQESNRYAYKRLIEDARIDIIQPDLGRCGGLTEGRKIATMIRDANRRLVPHAFKTGVLVAASAHFTISLPDGLLMEYTVSDSPLARELVEDPFLFQDGYIHVPNRPGLGVSIRSDIVRLYKG
jgi:L-alanine-DL-glutamate epimerase-like enolase superfamily enzyme